jgi:hypothetical protein
MGRSVNFEYPQAAGIMTERRYTDDEVAAIIATATEAQQSVQAKFGPFAGGGMTLAEVQEIGREVGIAPELTLKAARAIDQRIESSTSRFLGLPIGVGESAHLGRTVPDEEWERLVSDLRMTFNATGRTRQDGSFRQWSNGNLRAVLEPTEGGHRFRIQSMKGNARAYMMGGLGLVGLAAVFGLSTLLGASGNLTLAKIAQIGFLGAAVLAVGALQVPGWARERRAQMQALISRLVTPVK